MAVNSNALCTYNDILLYKDSYEDNAVPDNDTLIEELINIKTTEIHNYCGVEQFLAKEYTEYHDGDGGSILFQFNKPLISVSAIYDDSEWVWGTDTTIGSDYYRIVSNNHIVFKTVYPSVGIQNIKLVYTAGYETIPEDLRLACIKEVIRDFNRRYQYDVSSISDGDGSITYVQKGLLKSTTETLEKYRYEGIL